MKIRPLSALILIAFTCRSLVAKEPPTTQIQNGAQSGAKLFEEKILPVLVKNCYECHSKDSETIEGGLELDSPTGMARGGDSGPMFKAHQASQSDLIKMLRHDDEVSAMPPNEKLPADVIAAFEEWIRLGAPDPREDSGATAKEQRLRKAKQHWSFQPPRVTAPPTVKDAEWPRDIIVDSFVLARIEAAGMKPVADANRRTLARRLFFDLVGLPPTPEEVEVFIADTSDDAVGQFVDRLLDSPRFGERWGRHWLDVVRYAESSGMEFNFTYPHAWPYRDYVIDSFNSDKPFDEFLREQIAGDLLPKSDDDSPETMQARRVATSVLAFGPKRHNSSGTEFRMDMADDQIDVVFKSTLAMTVSCARCHDHKFDPIPTKDYYAVAGIFLSTEPLYGTIKQKYSNTPTDVLPIGKDADARHVVVEQYEQKIADLSKSLAAKREDLKKATAAHALAAKKKTSAAELLAAVSARQNATATGDQSVEDTTGQDARTALDTATTKLTDVNQQVADLTAAVAKLDGRLKSLKKDAPTRPGYAMSVRERAKPADTKLAVRGDFRNRGEVVPRGFLSAVNVPDAAPINPTHSGRLELAEWITSPDNPLTARVMVNRIWHHLFGRGIVSTVDNFGVIGKPPTHPELLDMLAQRFVIDGWSVKRMIRAIVLSRTYQLSSQVDAANIKLDPANRLLWRANPRRLEAEALRDAILSVSGQLELKRPNGSTVTALGDTLVRSIATEKIQPSSNHRSVYLPVVRDYVPELFDLFDFPSPSLVSGQRAVTNVPSQALYLRNSAFAAEQAQYAARRLLATGDVTDIDSQITLATRWALQRAPSNEELAAARSLVEHVEKASQLKPGDGKSATKKSPGKPENVARVEALSAWFLTLFTTAEFRYLVDITLSMNPHHPDGPTLIFGGTREQLK